MCGVAGIIGRLDEPNRAALQRMNEAMTYFHREFISHPLLVPRRTDGSDDPGAKVIFLA
jgi:hypothetical protein